MQASYYAVRKLYNLLVQTRHTLRIRIHTAQHTLLNYYYFTQTVHQCLLPTRTRVAKNIFEDALSWFLSFWLRVVHLVYYNLEQSYSKKMDMLKVVRSCSFENVKKSVEKHGIPRDSQWTDYAALKFALESRKEALALYLIQKNCRVNKTTKSAVIENTPLHEAAQLGNVVLVTKLLDKKASIVVVDSNGNSPLHQAFLKNHTEIIDILLKYMEQNVIFINIKNKQGLTHLHIASTRSNIKVIEGLLKTKTHIEDSVNEDSPSWPGYTAIHFAVEYTSVPAVEILSSQTQFKFQDAKNQAKNLVSNRIQKLVEARNMLENSKSDLYDLMNNHTSKTLLHRTFYNERYINGLETVRAFDALKDKITNYTDKDGLSHMHIACTRNMVEMVGNYLDNGADINARVSFKKRKFYNFSPLHFAVMYEKESMAEFLIEHGADINANDDNVHGTPLHIALKSRNKLLVDLLLKKGADVNSIRSADGRTTLHALIEHEYLKPFRPKPLPRKIVCFARPSIPIVRWSDYVERLVNKGVNIDAKDSQGNTALHLACRESLVGKSIVKKLLECGADVCLKNNDGLTAFDIALPFAYSRESSMEESSIDELMECGADVCLENNDDLTAFEMSCQDNSSFDKSIKLYNHVQNLKAAGQFLIPEIEECCQKFKDITMDTKSLQVVKDIFIDSSQERLEEVNMIKNFMINDADSLYDFLQLKVESMSMYLMSDALRILVESESLGEKFPVFAYLIWLKYQKVCACSN